MYLTNDKPRGEYLLFWKKKKKKVRKGAKKTTTKKIDLIEKSTPKKDISKRSKLVSLNKRRNVKREERTMKIVLSISMLFFVLSVGGSILQLITREQIPTMVVENGIVELSQIQQGIIIRDETIYKSTSNGEINYEVEQHQRVKKDGLVATIRNTENLITLEEESEDLTRNILSIQEQRSHISTYADDVNNINNQVQTITNSNIHRLTGTDTTAMNHLQEDVETYVLIRNEMLMSENRGVLEPYVNSHLDNEAQMSENISSIYASNSGVVSYIVDGMEEVLTPNNMENLTVEQTRMNINYDDFEVLKQTRANENIFKIVNSNEWFIASYIPNELVQHWEKGSVVNIYIERSGTYVPMDVTVHSLTRGEEETYVILKSRSFMKEHIDQRSVNFKTVNSEYKGLYIPQEAITSRTFLLVPRSHVYEVGDSHMVIKKDGDTLTNVHIQPRSIRSIETREDYVYILQDFNNLSLRDIIIRQGEEGSEYEISEVVTDVGVFIVNNGVATFTSINTEGMVVGENGYVVINPETNSGRGGVNVHDRIIADAYNYPVEEEQKIF